MTSAGLAYDTVWALAHGLDRAVDAIVKNDSSGCEDLPGDLVPLEKFNYQNEKMGCVLRKSIGNVHFPGITVSLVAMAISLLPMSMLASHFLRDLFHLIIMATVTMIAYSYNSTEKRMVSVWVHVIPSIHKNKSYMYMYVNTCDRWRVNSKNSG